MRLTGPSRPRRDWELTVSTPYSAHRHRRPGNSHPGPTRVTRRCRPCPQPYSGPRRPGRARSGGRRLMLPPASPCSVCPGREDAAHSPWLARGDDRCPADPAAVATRREHRHPHRRRGRRPRRGPALRRERLPRPADEAGLVHGWSYLVTTSGGLHIYFPADPDHANRNWSRREAKIDFRGTGGYVIAPPSRIEVAGARRQYQVAALGPAPSPSTAPRSRPSPRARPAKSWSPRPVGRRILGTGSDRFPG